jgi:hypothetical protein
MIDGEVGVFVDEVAGRCPLGRGRIGSYAPLQVSTAETVGLPCIIAAIPNQSSCSARCLTVTPCILERGMACRVNISRER